MKFSPPLEWLLRKLCFYREKFANAKLARVAVTLDSLIDGVLKYPHLFSL